MEYMRNFEWPSIYRVACPMYLWTLHFSIVSSVFVLKTVWKEENFTYDKMSIKNGTKMDSVSTKKGTEQGWNRSRQRTQRTERNGTESGWNDWKKNARSSWRPLFYRTERFLKSRNVPSPSPAVWPAKANI